MEVRIAVEYGQKTLERTYQRTTPIGVESATAELALDALDQCYRETRAALMAEAELLHLASRKGRY